MDYSTLDSQINKKTYRLKDVQNQIEKVAFDIVRFKDNDKSADLWQIQSSDDGEYIVALYQNDEEKVAHLWDVHLNKIAGTLQFSYKGEPIVSLSGHKLGVSKNELDQVPSYLPAKLAKNKKLVSALLQELPASTKQLVLNKFPELS